MEVIPKDFNLRAINNHSQHPILMKLSEIVYLNETHRQKKFIKIEQFFKVMGDKP